MPTYKQTADDYAARIARCRTVKERERTLEEIIADIDTLSVDNKPINERQKKHLYREIKNSLKELGFDERYLGFQINESLEDFKELGKSSAFVGNEELLELMSMMARGPKR